MSNDDLNLSWGFHPMQESYFLTFRNENQNLVPARVTSVAQDHCWVRPLGSSREFTAKASGKLQDQLSASVAVGDWVALFAPPGDHQYYRIEELLPRRTFLARDGGNEKTELIAANVNWICIVTSFNDDFSPNRIERALVMVQDGGSRPLIVVNKSDLVSHQDHESMRATLQNRFSGVDFVFCSTTSGWGIEDFVSHFQRGQTIAFLGMSGVGKSSLVNSILGFKKMRTQNIREDDSRGRHTTTSRNLILAPQGFWILDTPGIRSFAPTVESESVDSAFADIASLFDECRFKDCTHQVEEGCRVHEALETGELAIERWKNYQKIRRELVHSERKKDKAYLQEQKAMYRKRHKQMRQWLKMKNQT